MYLQAQMTTIHCVQIVETNRKFIAKTSMNGISKQFSGMTENQINRRNFNYIFAKLQQKAIFFRYSIETPCIIGN